MDLEESDSLSNWIKTTIVFLTLKTSEEYHPMIYSLWPIFRDAHKSNNIKVLKTLKNDLTEWIEELDEVLKNEWQVKLAESQKYPFADDFEISTKEQS